MSVTSQDRLDQQKFGSILVTTIWLLALPFLVAWAILFPNMYSLLGPAMADEAQPTIMGLPLVAIKSKPAYAS